MKVVDVSELNYTYRSSKKQALKSINFDINAGEIFGFLGPSGAGKTTTQRLIIGMLKKYDGQIKVLGKERHKWNNRFFEKIGVAFDFPNLYIKLTAEENLKLMSAYYSNKCLDIYELMDRVGLLKDKDKKVENFSKGMKMRLNFIRSIMHEPEIYFFDEPTSGLDPTNAKTIKDMIRELKNKGKTVFLTTHNMTVAEQLCDRVAFIVDGTLPVLDEPKNLMYKHGNQYVEVEYVLNDSLKTKSFDLISIRSDEHFFDIMRTHDIKTIHSQEASLEDVFIKLTGKNLQ